MWLIRPQFPAVRASKDTRPELSLGGRHRVAISAVIIVIARGLFAVRRHFTSRRCTIPVLLSLPVFSITQAINLAAVWIVNVVARNPSRAVVATVAQSLAVVAMERCKTRVALGSLASHCAC